MSQQLPEALLASLQTVNGFNEKSFVAVHASGEQITSIRFNPGKISMDQQGTPGKTIQNSEFKIQNLLPETQHLPHKVLWSKNSYYLSQRPSFTSDPLFHAGAYYVQEASSMFLEEAIRQTCDLTRQLKVLDLCAAPGGKSTLIQSLISAESLLVSNEVIKTRANILAENITKWGATNVVVTSNDPKDFQKLPGYFDLIVVDAPCSGSGLFRKDAQAIDQWSRDNVMLCSQRQQRILADVLPALKQNGILIYATCSYSVEEDEEILDWMLRDNVVSATSLRLQLKDEWNIIETKSTLHNGYGYRFYPDKLKGEGFFIAVFKNGNAGYAVKEIRIKNKPVQISKTEMELIKPFLLNNQSLSFFKWKEEIIAVPLQLLNEIFILQSCLYLKKAGVRIGSVIRNEFIPDHELALSNIIAEAIQFIEADIETALQYLRRGDLKITTQLKGWALIKYKSIPFGWIKILPNRINNYYPKEWRILNK